MKRIKPADCRHHYLVTTVAGIETGQCKKCLYVRTFDAYGERVKYFIKPKKLAALVRDKR